MAKRLNDAATFKTSVTDAIKYAVDTIHPSTKGSDADERARSDERMWSTAKNPAQTTLRQDAMKPTSIEQVQHANASPPPALQAQPALPNARPHAHPAGGRPVSDSSVAQNRS